MARGVILYSGSCETAYARVVELVDSLDSGSSAHSGHAGSSPASRTMKKTIASAIVFFKLSVPCGTISALSVREVCLAVSEAPAGVRGTLYFTSCVSTILHGGSAATSLGEAKLHKIGGVRCADGLNTPARRECVSESARKGQGFTTFRKISFYRTATSEQARFRLLCCFG